MKSAMAGWRNTECTLRQKTIIGVVGGVMTANAKLCNSAPSTSNHER